MSGAHDNHARSDDGTHTDFDFASKYTKAGLASRVLLEGFFGAIDELVQQANPSSVVEVGCGEGFSTRRLRQLLPDTVPVRAFEIEHRLVAAAQKRNPQVPIEQGTIYGLPLESGSADLVVSLEVLEHLDDPHAALRELARVSARHVVVSVPREPVWRALNFARGKYLSGLGNTPGHIQHWSRRAFVDFVGSVFDVVAVRSPLPWTAVLARRR